MPSTPTTSPPTMPLPQRPPDHHRKLYMDLLNLLSDPSDTHLLSHLFSATRDFHSAIVQFAREKGRESSARYKQSARYKMANHYVYRESAEEKAERERVAEEAFSRRKEDERGGE